MTIQMGAASLARASDAAQDADLFQAYWDSSVDGMFTMKVLPTGQFIHEGLNRALEVGTGLRSEQVQGRTPEEALPPSTATVAHERFNACMAAGKPIDFLEILDLPTGRRIWRGSVVPVRSASGRIERLLGRMHDDTEQWRSTVLLHTTTDLLHDTLATVTSPLAVLDSTGVIRMTNEAWRAWRAARTRRAGGRGANVGDNYLEFCDQAARDGKADAAVVRDGLDALLRGEAYTFRHTYQMGPQVFALRAARFDHGPETWVVLTHEDITAERNAERRAQEAMEHLLAVQEEERRRIALELHDSTSQHLVAIQLGLASLRRRPGRADVMDDMRREVAEAQREIRSLSYLLHPPKLAAEGLTATLRSFVEGFRKRTGSSVVLSTEGAIDGVPFEVQRALFRVIQEALSNAHRHAAARRISIELTIRRRGLRLIVANDGRRLSAEPGGAPGVGIAGMKARMEALGGSLEVAPTPFGTRVLGVVPAGSLTARP